MVKVALLSIFLNLFNIWLNRRQLDSHTSFEFNLLPLSHVLWKTLYTRERISIKKKK